MEYLERAEKSRKMKGWGFVWWDFLVGFKVRVGGCGSCGLSIMDKGTNVC